MIKFNETKYDQATIDAALATVQESLDCGWVVTGPRVEAAEALYARKTDKKGAVGFSIAPYFPLVAALTALTPPNLRKVAVQATAWPEQLLAFTVYGWEVEVFDIAPAHEYHWPELPADPKMWLPLDWAQFVFVSDVHGKAPNRLKELHEVCRLKGVTLIHDVSYGYGSLCRNLQGRHIGDIVTASLNPGKMLTGLNGGIASTDSPELLTLLKQARLDGLDSTKGCFLPVGDWRMLEVQGAVLEGSMIGFDAKYKGRTAIVERYLSEEAAAGLPGGRLSLERLHKSGHDRYVLRIPQGRKDDVRELLATSGIQLPLLTYDRPVDQHVAVKDAVIYSQSENAADWCASHVLLPLHERLSEDDIAGVCSFIARLGEVFGD